MEKHLTSSFLYRCLGCYYFMQMLCTFSLQVNQFFFLAFSDSLAWAAVILSYYCR